MAHRERTIIGEASWRTPRELDVTGLPEVVFGHRALAWWATIGFMAIEGTTLLVSILCWNEYLLSVFLSTSRARTMPILVAAMAAGERGVLWWTMSVTIVVMIVPVVFMALLLQRFITKGILLGAVKG